MNISSPFIARPVATTLITVGIALAGALALPSCRWPPLPQIDFPDDFRAGPTAGRQSRYGRDQRCKPSGAASRDNCGCHRNDLGERSRPGELTLQFGLDRDIDGAARDVQAAINAARADLPFALKEQSDLPQGQPGGCTHPHSGADLANADAGPALRRRHERPPAKESPRFAGVGQVTSAAPLCLRCASNSIPACVVQIRCGAWRTCGRLWHRRTRIARKAPSRKAASTSSFTRTIRRTAPPITGRSWIAYRNNAPVRLTDVGDVERLRRGSSQRGPGQRQTVGSGTLSSGSPARTSFQTVEQRQGGTAAPRGIDAQGTSISRSLSDRTTTIRASLRDTERTLVIAIAAGYR